MPCNFPIQGFRAPGGQVKFTRNGAWSDRPVTVSCGRCKGCRHRRSTDWGLRCTHEAQLHSENSFITLTYADDHLPPNKSLRLVDWQSFAKRLRKTRGPFRFLHCGEYGPQTLRPHYHAVIFGDEFDRNMWELVQQKTGNKGSTLKHYSSPVLDELWPFGAHTVTDFNFRTAKYTAKYILKKVTGPQTEDYYNDLNPYTGEVFERKPPYSTMSRRPGLGTKWFKLYWRDLYPHDYCIHNGTKLPVPKFYDTLLKRQDPELHMRVLANRTRDAKANQERESRTPIEVGYINERLADRQDLGTRTDI